MARWKEGVVRVRGCEGTTGHASHGRVDGWGGAGQPDGWGGAGALDALEAAVRTGEGARRPPLPLRLQG